jgi:hypothetical protein
MTSAWSALGVNLTCCAALLCPGETGKGGRISVNYDGFIDDVSVGDELLVDGGIISFVVRGKTDTDVQVGTCCRLSLDKYERDSSYMWVQSPSQMV